MCRSVSLVGEQERNIMKEVVKHAKTALKRRTVPPGSVRSLTSSPAKKCCLLCSVWSI